MSDYGTFESLGHEGYDKKIAAEKRDEALDRAAARIVEDTGDFFRNAASRDDFNQRWDMGITNVRRAAAKETDTSDDTMNAVRERVAALTIDTKPKPRKRATRHASTFLLWDDYDTYEHAEMSTGGHRVTYNITYNSDGTVSLWYNDSGRFDDDQLLGNHATVDEAKQAADEHYHANRTARHSRRKGSFNSYTDWSDFSGDGETGYSVDTQDGGTYYVVTTDGVSWTVYFESVEGYEETVQTGIDDPDIAKAWAGHHYTQRRPNAYDRTSTRRKSASVSPEQVTIDGKTGYMYQTDGLYDYLVYPNADGTYWDLYSKYRINDRFQWSQAGLSLSEAQQEAVYQVENDTRFTGNPDRDAPKATATTMSTPKGDTIRLASRRKSSALTWEQDGVGAYADKGDNTAYHIFKYPGDEYFSIKYYSNRTNGDGHVFDHAATLDEAKAVAEQEDMNKRSARRASTHTADAQMKARGVYREASHRVAMDIDWMEANGEFYGANSRGELCHITPIPGGGYSLMTGTTRGSKSHRTEHATLEEAKAAADLPPSQRAARRKQAALVWVEDPTEPDEYLGSDPALGANQYAVVFNGVGWELILEDLLSNHSETIGVYDSLDAAKQAADHALVSASRANSPRSARRKQAWSLGADGMTYTSDVAQDGFDCPSCGTGNKLGFSRCACGKQWNSYTIEGANGERRMVAREVEARPEAVLANRRRQARRKRAASEWFQRGNSERIELPGGVWCEVSEMSGKPGGPYGFIYGDGESVSGNVYDIGFPTMEQAKAAALDEVGFGGITANRRRQAGRARHSTRRAKRRTASTFTWDQDGHNPNGVSVGVFNDGWSFELERLEPYGYEYRLYTPDQKGAVGAYGFDTEDAAISEVERQHTFHATGEDPYNRNGKPSGKVLQLLSNRRPMEGRNKSAYRARRRAAQRKQAGTLQWAQDPQEPKSWSAESGQWAFDIVIGTDLWVFKDYQDGDMPISVKTYPDTDSAKRAAEDIANGNADPDQGVTARRTNRAGRAQGSRSKSAYQAGRRAAQRNAPLNPNAPMAYLTGYRDHLRSTIKRG